MNLSKIIVLFLFSFFAAKASAVICLATPPSSVDDPYKYYVSMINALKSTKDARDGLQIATVKAQKKFNSADLLLAMKVAEMNYSCAQRHISGYENSSNSGILLSSSTLFVALTSLHDAQTRSRELFEKALDGKNISEGERARTVSDLKIQSENAWENVMIGVIASTKIAIHFNDKSQRDGINLSQKKREDIIKRIRDFDPTIETKKGEGLWIEGSLYRLLELLKDKRLESLEN